MRRLMLCCLLLLITTFVQASERPRIGLVLSGGGARGIAHIGVLKVLDELRVPIDMITGTSMGAIVGGAYAAGVPIDEMEKLIKEMNWFDLFRDRPPRDFFTMRRKLDQQDDLIASVGVGADGLLLPEGAISGQKLNLFLRDLVGFQVVDNFDQLPIPYRAVATDLITGQPVIFEDGPLETALRASMSIPGLIAPSEAAGTLLVDGGLVRNLPVDIARAMGAEVVIAVNLGTPLLDRESLRSALIVTVQMIAILTEQNVQQSLAELGDEDVLILPDLGTITAGDFQRGSEAIVAGEAAAREQAGRLATLALEPAEYARWRQRHRRTQGVDGTVVVLDEVRIEQTRFTNPEVLATLVETRAGEPLDKEVLRNDLQRLLGRGDFDRIDYRVVEEEGRQVLVIDAYERTWGPDYLRFGLTLSSDFSGNNRFSLHGSYLRTWMNALGAEWQTDFQLGSTRGLATEFYQPLDVTGRWFVAPYAAYLDRPEDVFLGSQRVAEYRVKTATLGVDLGLNTHRGGEFRIGPQWRHLETDLVVGSPVLPNASESEMFLRARYRADSLDELNFPSRGTLIDSDLWWTTESLGADRDYGRVKVDWTRAFGDGDNRWQVGFKLGARLDGDLPAYDAFELGGFQNLSGLQPGQLRGQYLGFGKLVYQHRITTIGAGFIGELYAGGSLEAGNVWRETSAIKPDNLEIAGSVFLGLDSFMGPLFFGFGYAETGDSSLYLQLGRP